MCKKWEVLCSWPHEQVVSPSGRSLHLSILTLQRPTPVLSLFSNFQIGHLFSWPGGRDSLGCSHWLSWLASATYFSGLNLLVVVFSLVVTFKKLFHDFSRCFGICNPCITRQVSISILVLSQSACTIRLIWNGDMPESMYNFSIGVFFKQPVMMRRVSFRVISNFFACAERHPTALAYIHLHRNIAISPLSYYGMWFSAPCWSYKFP